MLGSRPPYYREFSKDLMCYSQSVPSSIAKSARNKDKLMSYFFFQKKLRCLVYLVTTLKASSKLRMKY